MFAVCSVDDIRIWGMTRTGVTIQPQLFFQLGSETPGLLAAFALNSLGSDNTTLLNDVSAAPASQALMICSSNACFVPLSGKKVVCGDGLRGGVEVRLLLVHAAPVV
jgi:hypothetical protein